MGTLLLLIIVEDDDGDDEDDGEEWNCVLVPTSSTTSGSDATGTAFNLAAADANVELDVTVICASSYPVALFPSDTVKRTVCEPT